ncbi:Rho guanine nucleotide exchange factor, putative [Entamoeba histolytica HM-1:IMSS-B]|uniref:Rho guanine nucleotide exchange factor, putative n=5 Tax=Entamoeba histolytica TaxID=5759 RepID=C4M9Y5_ENTH1|nr:Rho guanine nucleotide exchange factor, putative [Entamoeba histolytica HM-1:IMSS]EMD45443.1 rho guanine nucleotide exchange factor, putative [Entamoeba histolytica KU27]EMH76738.1 Rho guanine nucleotide exchange factor, putative [Entamoeba histolytica HM-1:IMSS-B]ENY62611.1 Rho guanine nucleotide exchange factor, putative [Entamoeba histolytica HM-1:IMSS-A]GAT98551.1 rho guanine nucleotide exchange factor putative [Entamoeba histolytica]EAL43992.1 Rho guanine nucleotide exchange factor, pu|eukprot:XP_649382.1 Rho guanine nucleotide exchange factor, putative [Entamoeba histolytica HM-1:IMSS]
MEGITKESKKPLTKRQRVAQEILTTEVSYVKSLEDCEKYYHEVLKQSKIAKQEEVDDVFRDFDQIIAVNEQLKKTLMTEDENEDLEDVIVVKFKTIVPFLKAYKQFVSYNEKAFNIIADWEENKAMNELLEQCRESLPGDIKHDLRSFLIMPVQRLPRYVLLLKELQKNTPKDHKDYDILNETLIKMEEVTKDVNESIKESERRLALFRMKKVLTNYSAFNESIAKKGEKCEKDIVQAHRFFVQEGELTKVCRKANKERYFVLFNDILIYGEGNEHSVQISEVFKMKSTIIKDNKDTDKIQNAFQIMNSERSFVVFAKSKEEKELWFNNISEQIKNAKETIGDKSQDEFIRPVFVPDSDSPECALCKVKFTFVNRRHHCRKCGKCICGECSKGRIPITPQSTVLERVCKVCFNEYSLNHPDDRRLSKVSSSKKLVKEKEKKNENSEMSEAKGCTKEEFKIENTNDIIRDNEEAKAESTTLEESKDTEENNVMSSINVANNRASKWVLGSKSTVGDKQQTPITKSRVSTTSSGNKSVFFKKTGHNPALVQNFTSEL